MGDDLWRATSRAALLLHLRVSRFTRSITIGGRSCQSLRDLDSHTFHQHGRRVAWLLLLRVDVRREGEGVTKRGRVSPVGYITDPTARFLRTQTPMSALHPRRMQFVDEPYGPMKIYQEPGAQFTGECSKNQMHDSWRLHKATKSPPSPPLPLDPTLRARMEPVLHNTPTGTCNFTHERPPPHAGVMVFKRAKDLHMDQSMKILEMFVAVRPERT